MFTACLSLGIAPRLPVHPTNLFFLCLFFLWGVIAGCDLRSAATLCEVQFLYHASSPILSFSSLSTYCTSFMVFEMSTMTTDWFHIVGILLESAENLLTSSISMYSRQWWRTHVLMLQAVSCQSSSYKWQSRLFSNALTSLGYHCEGEGFHLKSHRSLWRTVPRTHPHTLNWPDI